MRELLDQDILEYCIAHTTQPDDLLRALERETNLSTVTPQMIAGPYQGKFLEFITMISGAKDALEVGTFTGYAAICIARGLSQGGHLDAIEVNPEREKIISKYIDLAGLKETITLHIGDAFSVIPDLKRNWDLIFIDAGKRDNAVYYDLLVPRLNHKGILILDNVLWGGKVITEPDDKDAILIDSLNNKIAADERVECLMLPIRDGITVIRKK